VKQNTGSQLLEAFTSENDWKRDSCDSIMCLLTLSVENEIYELSWLLNGKGYLVYVLCYEASYFVTSSGTRRENVYYVLWGTSSLNLIIITSRTPDQKVKFL
jgi:hypothetical protein